MLGNIGQTRPGTLLWTGDFGAPMPTNSITLAFDLLLAPAFTSAATKPHYKDK